MNLFSTTTRIALITLLALVTACSPSLTEEELLSRARAAFEAGDVAAAELDLKTALQQNVESPAARQLYGEIYLWQIKPDAAVGEFERALRGGDNADLRLLLAKALVQAGESGELVSEYEAGSYATLEGRGEFHAAVARAYLAQVDAEAGKALLDQISEQGNDYVDITRAVYALQVDKDVDAARETLLAVTQRSPRNAHAWSLLGIIANSKNDRAAAEEYFGKAAEINPYRLGDRLEQVNALLRQGKSQAAAENLASLERLIPKYPEVNFMRGQLLFDEERYKEAVDSFALVLQAQPTHLGALLLSANANIQIGNKISAQRQLSDFLSLQPGHLQASLQLGRLLLEDGQGQRAEEVARSARMANDGNPGPTELLAASLALQGRHTESAQVYQDLARMQPESSEALVALGTQQLVAGDSDAAIARLEEAVNLDPANGRAHQRLIEAQLALRNTDAALEASNTYREQAPGSPEARIYTGRVYLAMEDYDAARKEFDAALALDPGNTAATSGVATVAVVNEDLAGAREAFESALEVNPGDLASSMNLAMVLEQEGNTDEMVEVLRATMEANPDALPPRLVLAREAMNRRRAGEAINLLVPVQESSAKDFRLWQVLTGAYIMAGQLGPARSTVSKLLELRPDKVPSALALAAEVAARSGEAEEAQMHLDDALEAEPDSEPLRLMLVQTLLSQNKIVEAGEQLPFLSDEALERPAVVGLRGRLALMNGNAAEAEALLQRAFELQPATKTRVLLSAALWEQGREDEALEGMHGWLSTEPDDAVVRGEIAQLELIRGNESAARDEYAVLVEQEPDNSLVLNNLAWLMREENPDKALEYARRAQELAPGNAQVLDTLALVELTLGNTQDALGHINEALELAPDEAVLQLTKARILVGAGRTTEAREVLRAIIDGPESASHAEAQAVLASLR